MVKVGWTPSGNMLTNIAPAREQKRRLILVLQILEKVEVTLSMIISSPSPAQGKE